MKEFRVEEELGALTLEQFFEFFFEGDSFLRQWHEKRGDTDVHLGHWTKAPDGNRKQRLIRFVPPPAGHPMIQRFTSNSRFKEVLHYHVTPHGEAVVTSVTMGEGGASVDLETRVEWTARIDEEGVLHCTIVGKDEYKRKLFKEMIENFMRESTEASIGLWVELVRRHLHHMGFTASPAAASLPSHPSSASERDEDEEAGEESHSDGDGRGSSPRHRPSRHHTGSAEGDEEEEEESSDEEDDEDEDARFVDAREALMVGDHSVSAAEEVVVLRAAVKGLEREVSSMERQLTKALTRVAGLQQTIQEITGDSAALSLSLPSLHQRLAALEHAQASAVLQPPAASTASLSLSSSSNNHNNGTPPATPEELEQAVKEVESDRRLARRNGRRHRSLNRNAAASLRENVNGSSGDAADNAPPSSSASSTSSSRQKAKRDPRRKLMWAGVATLVVLSLSLALPLLAPRSAILDRLLRPLRFLSSSFSRLSQPIQQAGSNPK